MIIKLRGILLLTALSLLAPIVLAAPKLPENLKWETNDSAKVWASPDAKKGGTYKAYIQTFPQTLRTVGPDSNGSFRSLIGANNLALLDLHSNTEEVLPGLATHWAYGDDGRTMYFKLNKKARWSDGEPVTADDFVYKLEFMRSEHIVAPWYNHHYTTEIEDIIKYDDHTLAVIHSKEKPDLWWHINQVPIPKHFYGTLDKNFVKKYNWKVVPNTGPYQIDKVNKGKSVVFKRKKDWWAKDMKYNKGRFNVDKVIVTVIREQSTVYEYFKKQKLDDFDLAAPEYWHEKSKDLDAFDKGYIHKLWFYNDSRRIPRGFYINEDREIFKDRNVRLAFSHSINMGKLLKTLLRGDYERLNNFTTGFGAYSNPNIKGRTFDIGKVEELMTSSGWARGDDGIWGKDGKRFSVDINYYGDVHTPRLVFLKEEAKKAGVEMILKFLDGSASFKLTLENKHDVSFMGWSYGFRPQYWQNLHSDNAHKPQTNNVTNTDDPEIDKLVEAYHASMDTKERIGLAHKIQQKFHDTASFYPSYQVPYMRFAYWRWWKFPEVPASKGANDLFDPFGDGLFWLDADEKKATLAAMKSGKTFPVVNLVNKTFKVE